MTRDRYGSGERGESFLATAVVGAIGFAALAVSIYAVVWARGQRDDVLTPQEQAYAAAIATQQADAYVAAVATQQASGPPPASAPEPPQRETIYVTVPATPVVIYVPAPTQAVPPPPPPPPAPPAPPPSPPATKPPMKMCVGYMSGLASSGLAQCQEIAQGGGGSWSDAVRNCVQHVISGTATTSDGKADCLGAGMSAGDPNLNDCFLNLSGQSHFGATSCRLYFAAG